MPSTWYLNLHTLGTEKKQVEDIQINEVSPKLRRIKERGFVFLRN